MKTNIATTVTTSDVLEKVLQYAQAAENFVVENAPQYVKEFLEYEAWYHQQWIYFGFIPFLLLLGLGMFIACLKKNEEEFLGIMGGAAIFFTLAIFTVPHSWVKLNKIRIAPRVYIIDSLRK